MALLRLEKVRNLEKWDAFAEQSLQYSIFSHSRYLEAMDCSYSLYFVCKGQQIKAGVSVVETENGKSCELDELVIYNGVLFEAQNDRKLTKARTERFEVTTFIIHELDQRYDKIEIALSPAFEDMRPFLWHNFNSDDPYDQFALDLRYTSQLDISEFFLKKPDVETLLYMNLENSRKGDIRKAEGNVELFESDDSGLFLKYYNDLLLSQRIETPPGKLARMKKLIDILLYESLAKMFVTKNESGQVTYMTVFTLYRNKGCYLFGAGDQRVMRRFDGTYCVWESMKLLSQHGVNEIDLEGVNSPHRGTFKLGFGGNLRPYYQVYKPCKNNCKGEKNG